MLPASTAVSSQSVSQSRAEPSCLKKGENGKDFSVGDMKYKVIIGCLGL